MSPDKLGNLKGERPAAIEVMSAEVVRRMNEGLDRCAAERRAGDAAATVQ
jgi:hypothetical protein